MSRCLGSAACSLRPADKRQTATHASHACWRPWTPTCAVPLQLVLFVEEVSSSKVKVPSLLRMYLWKMSQLSLRAIH